MKHQEFIIDLLKWIEGNLDQPLNLSSVARKSGYSKWHLQRMFRDFTGQSLGTYIRSRRLSKSAIALRLTGRTILDIAMQYHFDSQQTFTRSFKKQFSSSPGIYRRSPEWSSSGMCPPLRLANIKFPRHQFTTLDNLEIVGVGNNYECTLERMSESRQEMCVNYWSDFQKHNPSSSLVLYGLHSICANPYNEDEQSVSYTTAVELKSFDKEQPSNFIQITVPGGEYAQFDYEGPASRLNDFFMLIYDTCMPTMDLIRRPGYDIERIFISEQDRNTIPSDAIRCEYLIPISRKTAQLN